ncbi:MAG TPA: cyclic nucleotide-binding domain-containing protein, partial [Thermoanaerobaculia bacterium]
MPNPSTQSESDRVRDAARHCESAGLLAEADILFRLAATIDMGDHSAASASLARVLIAAGRLEAAGALAAKGDDPVLPAVLALETHDLAAARQLLDEARRRDPFDPRSASARGRLSFIEKRFPEAVGDLLEAALLRPEGVPDSTELRFLRAARALVPGEFPGWTDAVAAAGRRLAAAAEERAGEVEWPDRSAALLRCLIARGARSDGVLDRARRIADLPLAGMNDHALLAAAGAGKVRRIAPGNLLYRTGEAAAECFLVVAGALELSRTTPVGPQKMGAAAVADFAGEEALVGSQRTADARATEPTTVLGFAPDFFFEGGSRAAWLRHLRTRLAARLASLNALFEAFFPGASRDRAPAAAAPAGSASLSAEEKSRFLGSGGLSEDDRYLFGAFAEERSYPAESVIFREGDAGNALYAVARGRVRISRQIAGGEEALAIFGPGEIFGEMAVLNPESGGRSADARAHADA